MSADATRAELEALSAKIQRLSPEQCFGGAIQLLMLGKPDEALILAEQGVRVLQALAFVKGSR